MNLGKATKLGSLYNKIAISGLIIGIINLTILGVISTNLWISPKCTTCFFHFNIDYRLSLTEVAIVLLYMV